MKSIINTNNQYKKFIALVLSGILTTVAMAYTTTNIFQSPNAFAQTAEGNSTIDTFKAEGTISGIAADRLIGSNTSLGSHSADLFILGGNWSIAVENGNLSDITTDIIMTRVDGTGSHTHSIVNLKNESGAILPLTEERILLSNGNQTGFRGVVDLTQWQDVTFTANINNGNVLLLNFDPIATEHHFKGLPVFGTVTSLTDQSGNDIRTTQ